MIFKTFDNDIDKWTAKIGIFGKSFNDLGTAVNKAFEDTIDNIDNFDEDISFWDALKNNLAPQNEKGDSWIKNTLGEIISADNINSYISELDSDSAKKELEKIFNFEIGVKNGNATWQGYFDTLDEGSKRYIPDLIKNTNDLSKLTGDDLVKAKQQACEAAIAHNKALEQQTLGAKAAAAGLKALSIAGNILASIAINWTISKVIEGITNYINRLDNAIEATNEAHSEFVQLEDDVSSLNDELKTTQERINELEGKGTLTLTEEAELERLKLQNDELERQIALKEKEAEIAKQESVDKAMDALSIKATKDLSSKTKGKKIIDKTGDGGTVVEYDSYKETDILTATENELQVLEAYKEERQKLLADGLDTTEIDSKISEFETKIHGQITDLNTIRNSFLDSDGVLLNGLTDEQKAIYEAVTKLIDDWTNLDLTSKEKDHSALEDYFSDEKNSKIVEKFKKMYEEGKDTSDFKDFIDENEIDLDIESIDSLISYLKELEEEANKAGNVTKEFSRSDMISNLNSLSEGFEGLDKIYSSIADDDPFDFKLLDDEKFKENFSGLGDVYADFVEQITSNSDDIGACQDAFDDLVTAWISDTGVLDNVTEENKALTVSMLEQMGVANAEEIVTEKLKNEVDALAVAQESLNQAKKQGVTSSIDLENATIEEIHGLIQEYDQLGLDTTALYNYMQQKIIANNNVIATNGDINALSALCTQLGVASNAVARFAAIKSRLSEVSSMKPSATVKQSDIDRTISGLKTEAAALSKKMQNAVVSYTPTANYSTSTPTNTVSKPSTGNQIIKKGQQHAINFTGKKIKVDGLVGNETRAMRVRVLQHALNLDYRKTTIAEDGKLGKKTKAKLGWHYVKKGERQYLVTALEILLMLRGIDTNGVETPGIYGSGLASAVNKYFGGDGKKVTASMFLKLVQ